MRTSDIPREMPRAAAVQAGLPRNVSSEALAVKTNAQSIVHVDELRLFPVPRQTPTMQTIDYEHMLDAWAYTNQHPRHRFLSDPDVLHSN